MTDYQVLVELSDSDFPTNAQSDGGDIRFTADNGTELSYWIEEYNYYGWLAKIWVKVPRISASEEAKIMRYYGNPTATSKSNGDATFEFFDDFERTSLDTGKWDRRNPEYISVAGGKVKIRGGRSIDDDVVMWSKSSFPSKYVIRMNAELADVWPGIVWNAQKDGRGYIEWIHPEHDKGRLAYYDITDGSWESLNRTGISAYSFNQFKIIEVEIIWNIHKFYQDGALKSHWTHSYYQSGGKIGLEQWSDGPSEYDWILVRKYASREPTILITPKPGNPSVSLTKSTIPSIIKELETTTITIKTENTGSTGAKNIIATDSIPAEFTLVSGSMTQSYDLLKPNEHRTYQYTIKATETDTFVTDVASATYEDEKGNTYSSASNSVTITVYPPPTPTPTVPPTPTPQISPTPSPVTPIPTPVEEPVPELSISQSSLKGEPKLGEEVLITVAILNKGKATAKNIHLEERIPSSISVNYVEGADKAGSLVYWNGELDTGEAHSITHTLRILEEKSRTIPVTVTYEDASGKEKKKSTEIYLAAEEVIPTPTPTEEQEPTTIPWLYIIILVAVVLGGIAIIAAVRRKGEGGAEVTIEENTK